MHRPWLMMVALLLAAGTARATGFFDPEVQITNLTVMPRDAKTATVRFDVWWEGSWRHAVNHDAAWVFFKARADDRSEWQHVRLAADRVLNPTGYGQTKIAPPAPVTGSALRYYQGRPATHRPGGIELSPDFFTREYRDTALEFLVPAGADGFTGVFLRRAAIGDGTVAAHGVTAVLDLTSLKGIADVGKAQVRAFGMEMIYVAAGPFSLGTGGTELCSFHRFTDGTDSARPYRVTGAGAIPTGRQPARLWARGAQPEDGGEIPATFPNGFAAFYAMKNHISPRRYAEFLSTLPLAQAEARYLPVPDNVYGAAVIRSGAAPNYTYKFQNGGPRAGVGLPKLSWADGAAYAAWAGLRPATELEIEKLVRGPRLPQPDECGPSYWGIGPFCTWQWDAVKGWDQQSERAVTVGNAKGRSFKGTHGNGSAILPADWPQDDAGGSGMRCTWYPELDRARAADRLNAAVTDAERQHKFRAVRTAPPEAAPAAAGALPGQPN